MSKCGLCGLIYADLLAFPEKMNYYCTGGSRSPAICLRKAVWTLKKRNILLDIIRGVVIGVANIIPGVSGGTMMVSMGIYDTLIHCITHIFSEFKKSIVTLLPYVIGMGVGIVGLSWPIKWGLSTQPLPTACLFVGLILGSLPMIWNEMKGEKKGPAGLVLFILFFGLIILQQATAGEGEANFTVSFGEIVKLFCLGCIASAAMVIPGVSGSMLLMLAGYYGVVTGALHLEHGLGEAAAVLLPFALGIVVGIFGISKLIEMLLKRWKGLTYCAIMGLVLASPVAIVWTAFRPAEGKVMPTLNAVTVILSLVMMAVGFAVAWYLAGLDKKNQLK